MPGEPAIGPMTIGIRDGGISPATTSAHRLRDSRAAAGAGNSTGTRTEAMTASAGSSLPNACISAASPNRRGRFFVRPFGSLPGWLDLVLQLYFEKPEGAGAFRPLIIAAFCVPFRPGPLGNPVDRGSTTVVLEDTASLQAIALALLPGAPGLVFEIWERNESSGHLPTRPPLHDSFREHRNLTAELLSE
jgi:hypothetical protein